MPSLPQDIRFWSHLLKFNSRWYNRDKNNEVIHPPELPNPPLPNPQTYINSEGVDILPTIYSRAHLEILLRNSGCLMMWVEVLFCFHMFETNDSSTFHRWSSSTCHIWLNLVFHRMQHCDSCVIDVSRFDDPQGIFIVAGAFDSCLTKADFYKSPGRWIRNCDEMLTTICCLLPRPHDILVEYSLKDEI